MRVHKIMQWYVDMDHVLAVSEIKKKYPNMGEYETHSYDRWFEIELAFKSNPFIIGIEINRWTSEEEKQDIVDFHETHSKFIEEWKKHGSELSGITKTGL